MVISASTFDGYVKFYAACTGVICVITLVTSKMEFRLCLRAGTAMPSIFVLHNLLVQALGAAVGFDSRVGNGWDFLSSVCQMILFCDSYSQL